MGQDGGMEEPVGGEVTVTLGPDGNIGIRLSETDRPAQVLRAAASVLQRFAASIERDQEPIACPTCGLAPEGVLATPSGDWHFLPCGHGASGV